ncbi:glycosyltransferase family 4 protein [Chroococcidiopsis sp. TS-821]|uniref:glycosyltransferase family 4 protein n=1 Tax=Chroococcidiopsis sp. TS-821 TaxID=1378066 RepID=UPI000CEE08ED|nr:glycosyltransferase family 4 protein [Chroococcidiopsis sp. TS-821]PPS40647.1 glycosyl transferase [Chroococcidiopsis sp. TS-821]
MKVLHINQSDVVGGAAIAGTRLHQGLLSQGIDSYLLVGKAQTFSDRIAITPKKNRIEHKLRDYFAKPLGLTYLNILSSFNIPKSDIFKSADIINFHNLHTGYFNYLAIPSLTANKPAVWTLHDMWSFTGHCSYSYDCDRWKIGCGRCPYPQVYPKIQRDNTRIEWKLKDWTYSRSDLTIVTLSHWLTAQVKQSILKRFPIYHIPNGIDTTLYQPLDPDWCKQQLGLPKGKKVLMFGAASLQDSRKGGDLLLQALQKLPASLKSEIVLLTFGGGEDTIAQTVAMPAINLGYIDSDRLKAVAYSAADLFIFPTRADNLPLVLQESMACGTPMVSCKVGGVPDLVRPGVTGYLAIPEDPQDLSVGITQLLEDDTLREKMSQNCRKITLEEYSLELQVQRYIDLYSHLIQNFKYD